MNAIVFEALLSISLLAGKKEEGRLEESATVVQEILDIPDGIPQELLDKAECVVVLPSVKKLAIGIGGSYGRGVLVCRTGADFEGAWGPPALYRHRSGRGTSRPPRSAFHTFSR